MSQKFGVRLRTYYGQDDYDLEDANDEDEDLDDEDEEDDGDDEDTTPLILGVYDTKEQAVADLPRIARAICPKGWDDYNSTDGSTFWGGSYDDKRLTDPFILLEDDCLYGSSLSVVRDEAEKLEGYLTHTREVAAEWEDPKKLIEPGEDVMTSKRFSAGIPWCDPWISERASPPGEDLSVVTVKEGDSVFVNASIRFMADNYERPIQAYYKGVISGDRSGEDLIPYGARATVTKGAHHDVDGNAVVDLRLEDGREVKDIAWWCVSTQRAEPLEGVGGLWPHHKARGKVRE